MKLNTPILIENASVQFSSISIIYIVLNNTRHLGTYSKSTIPCSARETSPPRHCYRNRGYPIAGCCGGTSFGRSAERSLAKQTIHIYTIYNSKTNILNLWKPNNNIKKNMPLINKVQANKHTHTVMYQYYFEFVRLNSLLALHLLSWTKAHKQNINK